MHSSSFQSHSERSFQVRVATVITQELCCVHSDEAKQAGSHKVHETPLSCSHLQMTSTCFESLYARIRCEHKPKIAKTSEQPAFAKYVATVLQLEMPRVCMQSALLCTLLLQIVEVLQVQSLLSITSFFCQYSSSVSLTILQSKPGQSTGSYIRSK